MNDIKITDKAKTIIEEFDTTDLLATLGAMNLLFDNQNKNYATSYYSAFILFNQNSGKPKASRKTLSSLVEEMNKSGIIMPIQDPPEAPFFQKILFDMDYCVFNGVDHHAAFFVSRLCELLAFGDCSPLPKEYQQLIGKIVRSSLIMSDMIAVKLKPNYDDTMEYPGDKDIILPANIENLKSLLYFDKSDFYQMGLSEEDIQRYFVFHLLPEMKLRDCLDKEIPFYYKRPFIDCGDKLLLVDPTSINTYIRFFSLELAESFDCKDVFIEIVNETSFAWGEWQIRKSTLTYLDDKRFDDFKFINNETYKETIIPFSKTRIILYSACFDNNLEGKWTKVDIDKYHKSIKKQLNELKDTVEVTVVVLCFTYGAGLNVKEPHVFENSCLLLPFDEFESFVINEKHNPCAIFNTINYVQVTKHIFPPTMGEMNRIAFLHSNDYDFYLDDKADAYNTNLFVGFELTYHYRTLAAKEETNFVAFFYKQLLLLEKDSDNLYYLSPRFFDRDRVITYNRYHFGGVWVYSKVFDYNLVTFIGMVNYWLTNLKELLTKQIDKAFYIQLCFNRDEQTIVKQVGGTCLVNVMPIIISINEGKPFDEINLIKQILKCLGLLIPVVEKQLNDDFLDSNKRYNTPLSTDQIMLIPFRKQLKPIFISKYQSALLDDSIGRDYAIEKLGLVLGEKIGDADSFLKGAVTMLFDKLDAYAKTFDWLSSVQFMYEYQEDYLQKLLINKKNLKVKHALYTSHIDDINRIYYDLNSTSPCIRFLIQYFATMQYQGTDIMDECDLESLITLVHKIIHLANVDDGIVFGLLPKEVTLLRSKRLGIDLTNLEKFNSLLAGEMINDLVDTFNLHDEEKWPFSKELDEAYLEEHGFTFSQMSQVVSLLLAIGEEQQEEIKATSLNDVLKRFKETKSPLVTIDEQIILLVIDHLSFKKRDVFFDHSFQNFRDLYPWRFNRTESITRKPLIRYGDNLIWGDRTLYQCIVFTVEHVYEGKEPTKNHSSGKLKTLNGKILELKGERFNDLAFNHLSSNIANVDFYKCIKSFNNKRMTDNNGNFLGDIDILGIDQQRQRIYLIEVKDYQYSKNMAEFGFEQDEFLGTNKKKGFVKKELNRVKWVKEHLDDVKKEYNLNGSNWKVLYTFLSNKPLLCSVFGKVNFNNICIAKIDKKYLNSLDES